MRNPTEKHDREFERNSSSACTSQKLMAAPVPPRGAGNPHDKLCRHRPARFETLRKPSRVLRRQRSPVLPVAIAVAAIELAQVLVRKRVEIFRVHVDPVEIQPLRQQRETLESVDFFDRRLG